MSGDAPSLVDVDRGGRGLGRGLGDLHLPVRVPLQRAAGRPRGLDALFEAAAPLHVALEAVPVVDEADVVARAERDWTLAPGLDALLHLPDVASLPIEAATDLALDELADAPHGTALLTVCGQIARTLVFPGRLDRDHVRGADRCARCSSACGYPPGRGSPAHDPACATIMAQRLRSTR